MHWTYILSSLHYNFIIQAHDMEFMATDSQGGFCADGQWYPRTDSSGPGLTNLLLSLKLRTIVHYLHTRKAEGIVGRSNKYN